MLTITLGFLGHNSQLNMDSQAEHLAGASSGFMVGWDPSELSPISQNPPVKNSTFLVQFKPYWISEQNPIYAASSASQV